jgi:hypothetical protein
MSWSGGPPWISDIKENYFEENHLTNGSVVAEKKKVYKGNGCILLWWMLSGNKCPHAVFALTHLPEAWEK